MRFAEPLWLWSLTVLPLLALGGVWSQRSRRRGLACFAGGAQWVGRFEGEVSGHRRLIKHLLIYAGLAALGLALARPQWGTRAEAIERRGADVVLVLDTSLSMAAEDLAPSRLAHARHAAGELARRLEGDRIGLVSFSGQAVVNCPLTVDVSAVRLFLDTLDVRTVSVPGTALAQALTRALDALRPTAGEGAERGRAIVVFTDGEDHEGGIDEVLPALERAGVPVWTIGTGTTRGAPIPLRDAQGLLTEYKKDKEGKVVTTRLDESLLERIALDTGGRYVRASATDAEVDEIVAALGGLETGRLGSLLRTRWEERFQIPLAAAWLLLAAEALIGERRRAAARTDARREAA